jgi:hypothetical protein
MWAYLRNQNSCHAGANQASRDTIQDPRKQISACSNRWLSVTTLRAHATWWLCRERTDVAVHLVPHDRHPTGHPSSLQKKLEAWEHGKTDVPGFQLEPGNQYI